MFDFVFMTISDATSQALSVGGGGALGDSIEVVFVFAKEKYI